MPPLTPDDLVALSHLLDEVEGLPRPEIEARLAALPPAHAHLVPLLREHLVTGNGPTMPDLSFPCLRDPAPPGRSGDHVGPYRLVRELASGGMGVVWLAERSYGQVCQPVALKMPLVMLSTPTRVERFEREREVLALLSHPHIARLVDAGITAEDRPYLVMEYVPGLPIHEACDSRRLGLAERVRLFLQVLAAVDHAHRHLVVHRDIKPSNVFVGSEGQVKLLDFGIAKLLQGAPLAGGALTQEGSLAFTAAYAAPEQFDGGPVTTETDIYALGVLLHELFTGTLPHPQLAHAGLPELRAWRPGETAPASLSALSDAAAERRGFADAAGLRAALRGDLETILRKALRLVPCDRYPSAERFAEDLQRWLEQRPILARPPTWHYRAGLLLRRHRAVAVAVAAGLVLATTLAGLGWRQHLLTEEQRARAEQVREFMYDLVEDAEPDEQHPGAEPTGRQMVAAAVQRARDRFGTQPRLKGEVLAELGLMLGRLGDAPQGARLQREAYAVLLAHAPPGDGALNQARANLAGQLLESGDVAGAQALAAEALRHCLEGNGCAKARVYGEVVLARAALMQGRGDAALEHMRQAVDASEIAFGPTHAETALRLTHLAAVQRQAGDYEAAQASVQRALSIVGSTSLRMADRIEIGRMDAVLKYDTGDHAGARAALAHLRHQTRDPATQAQLWRLLAHVEYADGDLPAAGAAAAQVEQLVRDDPQDIERILVRQLRARIAAVEGHTAQAARELEAVIAQLRASGYGPDSMEVLRARRYQAEARLRGGDTGTLADLEAVAQAQEAAGPAQLLELAQTMDLVGHALVDQGRAAEALGWHDKARRLFAQRLAGPHPLLLRNACYQAMAAWRATGSASSDAQLRATAKAYEEWFPNGSTWRDSARRTPSQAAACPPGGAAPCSPVL